MASGARPRRVFTTGTTRFIGTIGCCPTKTAAGSSSKIASVHGYSTIFTTVRRTSLPLLLRNRIARTTISVFSHRGMFVRARLVPLQRHFPGLQVILRRVAAARTMSCILRASHVTTAVAPRRLLCDHVTLFRKKLQPRCCYLPILGQRARHRTLIGTTASNGPGFFLNASDTPRPHRTGRDSYNYTNYFSTLRTLRLCTRTFRTTRTLSGLRTFTDFCNPSFCRLPHGASAVALDGAP